MNEDDNRILDKLGMAAAGLLYMSEADYPLQVIKWDGPAEPTLEFIRSIAGVSSEAPVEQVKVERFFRAATYGELLLLMNTLLSNSRVYKVGSISMPVYVVGLSPGGKWLGYSTRVVET
jgi:hypothetical protein